jgi:TRAP-type mannitol/chloroaromatic compound transport system permease small subunit
MMRFLKAVLRSIDVINERIAKAVSWLLLLIVAATVYEVFMRYLMNSPTNWVFEFNYLVHGPYFLLVGAYAFAQDAHVNVDIFYNRFTVRQRAIIDLFTLTFFFFFVLLMLVYGARFALNSYAFRETLSSAWAPPVYPVKMAIPVAAFLLLLQGLARYIRCLHLAITGREGEL